MGTEVRYWPLGLLVSLFFLWGAANNLNDILIKQFKKAFTLGDMQASLVQSAFYLGYFIGALPAARLARAWGFRVAIITGLCLFSLGSVLFFPVSRHGGTYIGLLVCLYLIAFGLAFLESSANPWIVLMGDSWKPGSGTRALNFAQAFNPLGSIAGILVGRLCILDGREPPASAAAALPEYREHEAALVGLPYVVLGVVVAAVACAFGLTRFPSISEDRPPGSELTVSRLCTTTARLCRSGGFAQGLLAQFAYVGAQVCAWSFIIRLVQEEIPGTAEQRAADFVLFGLIIFVGGRFVASALLHVVSESKLLCAYAALACTTCIVIALAGGKLSVVAVCLTSFFMSMMFPTIFGLVLSPLAREDTEVGSALLVMCVVGGAVLTPIMGVVSDASSVAVSYLVPACCFLIVMSYALQHSLGRFDKGTGESKPLLGRP